MDTLVFRSRVDPLLASITFGPLATAGAVVVRQALVAHRVPSPVVLVTLGLSLGLLAWIFLDTAYRITSTELLVRSGPLRITVPLSEIRRVRRTRSVLSAPALSLRRLEVAYARGSAVVISPADEAGFLAALRGRGAVFDLSADLG